MKQKSNNIFAGLDLNSHSTLQEQVRRHVRQLIVTGTLKPGQQLPSMHELARQWQTNVRTVHLAIGILVREGMLTSVPGVGTFVCKPETKLTRVGLVYSREVWAPGGSDYVHSVHTQLTELLEAQGIEVTVWVDNRPKAEQTKSWDVLREAAMERKIQAMIVPTLNWDHLPWMEKLPIPAAFHTSLLLPNSVHMDLHQFIELSLERLVTQGCRSVGLIFPDVLIDVSASRERVSIPAVIGRFVDRATDMGLKVKNEWVQLQKLSELPVSPKAFGYRAFQNLWSQSQRPEGLVVGDDVVMQGVITSVLEARVDVPRQLKIVSGKNKYIELLSPFPVSHVVLDEREIAQALIEQVQTQFRGDRCGVSAKWIGYQIAPLSDMK